MIDSTTKKNRSVDTASAWLAGFNSPSGGRCQCPYRDQDLVRMWKIGRQEAIERADSSPRKLAWLQGFQSFGEDPTCPYHDATLAEAWRRGRQDAEHHVQCGFTAGGAS